MLLAQPPELRSCICRLHASKRLLYAVCFVLAQVSSSYRDAVSSSVPCIHEGHLKTDRNWFGYLANITVIGSGRLTFEFIYPVERCCQNVLFYRQDQLAIIGTSDGRAQQRLTEPISASLR